VWLSGVAVDWGWLQASGYTTSGEPDVPAQQPVLIIYNWPGYYVIGNSPLSFVKNYICEFPL
jgi:hypothetical protein